MARPALVYDICLWRRDPARSGDCFDCNQEIAIERTFNEICLLFNRWASLDFLGLICLPVHLLAVSIVCRARRVAQLSVPPFDWYDR